MTSVSDFLGDYAPDSGPVAPVESAATERELPSGSAPPPATPVEPQFVTETMPSGLEVLYQWAPKRLYRVRKPTPLNDTSVVNSSKSLEWTEVPSVTTVLGCLDKSGALTWWGMKVGVDGVAALAKRGLVVVGQPDSFGGRPLLVPGGAGSLVEATGDVVAPLLTENKLTVNHIKEDGGRRGQSAHDALETWIEKGILPQPEVFPEEERGYVTGLRSFLEVVDGKVEDVESEVMVGSLQNEYAGRYDIRFKLLEPVTVCTRVFPKRADIYGEIPVGKYLPDLKTSKYVYSSHFLQLEAYEGASVESGYEPTDYRAVIHVTADGRYEFVVNPGWTLDDFLAVKGAYLVTARKGWK